MTIDPVDRKTARRFAYAATSDHAVARAVSRPTVLDRYQPHLHRRWTEGCHDAAVLHAEITALGYRGSLRTVYRYLQPLRAGADPAALAPAALKTGEFTSWLLRRAEDLSPGQQQLLTHVLTLPYSSGPVEGNVNRSDLSQAAKRDLTSMFVENLVHDAGRRHVELTLILRLAGRGSPST